MHFKFFKRNLSMVFVCSSVPSSLVYISEMIFSLNSSWVISPFFQTFLLSNHTLDVFSFWFMLLFQSFYHFLNFLKSFNLLILEREKVGGEREKHWFVVPLFHAFISWFLFVPWPRVTPSTLAYWEDALTNWVTGQGFLISFKLYYHN